MMNKQHIHEKIIQNKTFTLKSGEKVLKFEDVLKIIKIAHIEGRIEILKKIEDELRNIH